jgi:hypothetical protein
MFTYLWNYKDTRKPIIKFAKIHTNVYNEFVGFVLYKKERVKK